MNFNEIRNMSDSQLKKYLNGISTNKTLFCARCGEEISRFDRKIISAGIYNSVVGQKAKQICILCNHCYVDLLDFLCSNDPF